MIRYDILLNKFSILLIFFVSIFPTLASAQEVHLSCKIYPVINGKKIDNRDFDANIELRLTDGSVIASDINIELPLKTSANSYTWQFRFRDVKPDADDVTWIAQLDRYTGEYNVFLSGDRGVKHASSGTCQRLERVF